MSPVLPYTPMRPSRSIATTRSGRVHTVTATRSMTTRCALDLYPTAFGSPPNLQWFNLSARPYGYPVFDAMDGFELICTGKAHHPGTESHNTLVQYTVTAPFPIIGNLFIDRINKYALCALQVPRVDDIDLYRFTQGDLYGGQGDQLPFPPTRVDERHRVREPAPPGAGARRRHSDHHRPRGDRPQGRHRHHVLGARFAAMHRRRCTCIRSAASSTGRAARRAR